MFVRRRTLSSHAAALALCTLASVASAQDSGFARSGAFAFGADRLFGVQLSSATVEGGGGGESTASATEISLLAAGSSATPYGTPRLAFDGFVSDGLSLGGFFGILSQSSENEATIGGATTTMDGPSELGILFGARVGYGHMFSNTVGIWPRLGLTYFTHSIDGGGGTEVDLNGLALTFDAPLVIAPVPHFGFTLGPFLDLGLTGATEVGTTSTDTTITDFGLQVGVLGWL